MSAKGQLACVARAAATPQREELQHARREREVERELAAVQPEVVSQEHHQRHDGGLGDRPLLAPEPADRPDADAALVVHPRPDEAGPDVRQPVGEHRDGDEQRRPIRALVRHGERRDHRRHEDRAVDGRREVRSLEPLGGLEVAARQGAVGRPPACREYRAIPCRHAGGDFSDAVLAWWREHGRDLPWRRTRDPYALLVAEVMLQQTQVTRVVDRWTAWLERWPDAASLAAATPAEVLQAWQGMGYNRRALNLHRASRVVAAQGWPTTYEGLRTLPGVGPYTAAALAVQAFGADLLPVDVNVRRVLERALGRTRPRAADRARLGLPAGPVRPRRHGLPGARPALRPLSRGRRLPVARAPLRASPPPGPLRGVAAAGPRAGCSTACARVRSRCRTPTPRSWRRSCGTAWRWSRIASLHCRRG